MSTYESLPPHQLNAARLTALGYEPRKVADQLQMSVATLYEWRQDPRFRQATHELKLELHKEFLSQVSALAAKATERLAAMIDQEIDAPITHADQFKAIRMVFEMSNEAVRTETLLREIEQLKELITHQTATPLVEGVTVETLEPVQADD